MILAAEYIPSPLRLMLGLTPESGIGSPESAPIPDFFFRESGRESPIPDLAGKQGIPIPDSAGKRESGSRFAGPGISWPGLPPFRVNAVQTQARTGQVSGPPRHDSDVLGQIRPCRLVGSPDTTAFHCQGQSGPWATGRSRRTERTCLDPYVLSDIAALSYINHGAQAHFRGGAESHWQGGPEQPLTEQACWRRLSS
jgi:hypothetical protein